MHGYGGWGGDWQTLMGFYTNLRFFINLYWCEQFLRQCGFFKQPLVQNELKFNLWVKWMKHLLDNTFS